LATLPGGIIASAMEATVSIVPKGMKA